jgi:hypothetical protein
MGVFLQSMNQTLAEVLKFAGALFVAPALTVGVAIADFHLQTGLLSGRSELYAEPTFTRTLLLSIVFGIAFFLYLARTNMNQ